MIVLTGASGGIGTALAMRLAARGKHLVLTARDRPRLEALATRVTEQGGSASVRPANLRDQEQVQALVQEILAQDGVPEAVICLGQEARERGMLIDASFGRPHDLVRLTGTNLLGPATLLLGLLEAMAARGSGRLLVTTSATARIPAPGWAAYGASKAGLDTWLRSIRPDAIRHGVGIAVMELPLVATTMAAPTYGRAPRGALSAEQAADQLLRALDGRRSLYSPWWARLGAIASAVAPSLAARAAGRAGRLGTRLLARDLGRPG